MECPSCGLLNPESAQRCDCGYDFQKKTVEKPYLKEKPTSVSAMELVLHGNQRKTLTVAGDSVRIEKKGLLTGKREKTFPIRNITSVEVKKPGAFVGFIQFSIAGGTAHDSSYKLSGGAFDAVKDENSVVFNGQEKYEIALKVKAYVEARSTGRQRATLAQKVTSFSVADEIRKLKALLDEGLLTAEEFEQKKKKLLAN